MTPMSVAGADPRGGGMHGERIDALTGLRFLAALAVVVEHFPQIIPGLSVVDAAQGGAGVSLFFVLSGFVLTHTYGDRFSGGPPAGGLRRYIVARIGRIVPLHLAALALVAALVLALRNPFDRFTAPAVIASLVANALLVHAWFPTQVFHFWNGPAWSISVELFFYLSFPLLIPWVVWPLLKRRWLGRSLVAVTIVHVAMFLTVSIVAADVLLRRNGDVEGARLIVGRIGNVPAIRLGEFVIGCLLGAAFRREHRDAEPRGWTWLSSRRAANAALLGAAVALAAIQFTPSCPRRTCAIGAADARSLVDLRLFVVYLPVVVVIVAVVAWGASSVNGLLATRSMVVLGEASYALYLLQWGAWLIVNQGDQPPSQVEAIVAVLVTIVLALVTHRLLEQPARRWVVSRFGPAAPSTGRAGASTTIVS